MNPSIPEEGDEAAGFEALVCDGETFRNVRLEGVVGERGCVLVFFGFCFSAVAENWWKRYERRGWHEFDGVEVVGVGRDGPYAQNAFIRSLDSPFRSISDVNAEVAREYGVVEDRDGMANTSTPRRAYFVLDAEKVVRYSWVADEDDWIHPPPADEVEEAVEGL
ncbi:MAG: redoxin domain-containing protein [Halobacteria archaeon]|nr:redoxin domain-containing protein [Halobacteria archaeon]